MSGFYLFILRTLLKTYASKSEWKKCYTFPYIYFMYEGTKIIMFFAYGLKKFNIYAIPFA